MNPAHRAPEGAAERLRAFPWPWLWLPVVLRGRVARVQHGTKIDHKWDQSGPGGGGRGNRKSTKI